MRILPLILLCLLTLRVEGALTNLVRETFRGYGALTAASPGALGVVTSGTFYQRAGGPRETNDSSAGGMGWSADLRISGAGQVYHTLDVRTSPALTNGCFSAWFFVSGLAVIGAGTGEFVQARQGNGNPLVRLLISPSVNGNFWRFLGGVWSNQDTGVPVPLFQWFELRNSWGRVSGNTYNWRAAYRLAGTTNWVDIVAGTFTFAGTIEYIEGGQLRLSGGGGSYAVARYGMPSIYSMGDYTNDSVALISDVADPVSPVTYYVNPSSGNDTNSGCAPSEAWKTAGKINEESVFLGMLAASAYTNGPTLVVDTTSGLLDLSATNLTLATPGLNVVATNSTFWTNLLCATLTNAHFTGAGPANVYQIATYNNAGFGQSNIVVWEDDKWLNHPAGATWASVSNYVCTNAGSFWTDGATIYVHPFGNSNPTSDGKSYTRSVARDASGYSFAINLKAVNMNFRDCHAGKTAMIKVTDNADGLASYVVGSGDLFGGTSQIAHCYLYYGSKHILGLVADADNSDVTIEDVQAEQCARVSATAFVSFMAGATKTNNVHRYVRCVTERGFGAIGSIAGEVNLGSDMLMHNIGSGVQFREVIFDACRISGTVGWGITTNALVTNCTIGGISPGAVVSNRVVNSRMFGAGISLIYNAASNTLIENCTFTHTNNFTLGAWNGNAIQGVVDLKNCSFDFSGLTGTAFSGGYGPMWRYGRTFLTVSNCVFKGLGSAAVYTSLSTNDTVSMDKNIYDTTGNIVVNYTNSASGADRSLAQWQGLGFDASSIAADARLDSSFRPYADSPARQLGPNAPGQDITGRTFPARRTAGAVEYVAPTGGFKGFAP